MLWFFLASVLCEFINVSLNNIARTVGGRHTVFVKFYSSYCRQCVDVAHDFSEASTMFPAILFAGCNCSEEENICEQLEVQSFPSLQLFLPRSRNGLVMESKLTLPHIIDFLHKKTRFRAGPSPRNKLLELNHLSWTKFADNIECGLVLFHNSYCQHCQHFLPQLALLTQLFDCDRNVSIAALNCSRFRELCRRLGVVEAPEWNEGDATLRYFANGTWTDWGGKNMTRDLLELVNTNCGTSRALDGLLSDQFGTIPQADAIARRFAAADNKDALIEEMRRIDGAEFYVKVMTRFQEKGVEQIKSDAIGMKNNLDKQTGSKAVLDVMKARYNVYVKFLPTPTPRARIKKKGVKSPTPTPDQGL
jgi:thiol-disulfide isomerase/thioredoxin